MHPVVKNFAPSPKPWPGLSFSAAMKPSSEIEIERMTFPTVLPLIPVGEL
jgi:hypothetical protein